jgi:hypothetical protein
MIPYVKNVLKQQATEAKLSNSNLTLKLISDILLFNEMPSL